MERNNLAAITKTITVKRPASEAFDIFVKEIAAWWPLQTHSIGADKGNPAPISVAIEEFVGGRIYETGVDGSTCDWGKILEFEAGKSLRILWQLGRPESLASEVVVHFEPLDNESCRVVLKHEHWERLGERAIDLRGGYESGWDIVFGKLYAGRANKA
jgi:uncharacterized protein YndB with AHSA1/START domain